jgi:acetyl esterase/lipase
LLADWQYSYTYIVPSSDKTQAYEHASELHADTSKYIAMGGSAGGGLAVSVVHKLIRNGHRDRISGLVPLASTNLQRTAVPAKYQHLHTSMIENSGEIPFVTAVMSDGVYNLLGGNPPYNDESKHWFPVTMGVEGVEDFPPTWILDCEKDCMRDDGRVLQAEMEDAGLKVKREVVKGMPHYYWAFPVQAAAEDFRKRLLAGLKWVLYSQEDELLN